MNKFVLNGLSMMLVGSALIATSDASFWPFSPEAVSRVGILVFAAGIWSVLRPTIKRPPD